MPSSLRHFFRFWGSRAFSFLLLFLPSLTPAAPAPGVPQLLNYQGRVTVQGQNFTGTGQFKFALVDGGKNQNVTALASCTVNPTGRVESIAVLNGGRGYDSPPRITILGTGSDAEAEAVVDKGVVVSINVTRNGSDYSTVTPTEVVISPPPEKLVATTYWSNDGSSVDGIEPAQGLSCQVNKGLYSVLLGDAGMSPLKASIFNHQDVRLRVWFSPSDREPSFTLLSPDQRIAAVGYALMADDVKDGAITSAKLAANSVTLDQLTPELRQTIQSLQAWQATQLPVITSSASASAAVDNPFTYQISASGSPSSFGASGLPSGWTLNSTTGVVSGTPAADGVFVFSVTATNSAGTGAPRSVSVTVAPPVYVDAATGADGNAGTPASPVRTLTQGVAVAAASPASRSVRVSGAVQLLTAPLALQGGVNLRGGYNRAAGWSRTSPRTPLTYQPSAAAPAAVTATGLQAPALLDGFAVSSLSLSTAGASVIGVRIAGCAGVVTLSNNSISAGAAGTGGFGTPGANGLAGAGGFNAVSWRGPAYPAAAASMVPSFPPSYYFGCGGTVLKGSDLGSAYSGLSAYEGWPGGTGGFAGQGGAPGNAQTPPGNGTGGGNGVTGVHGVSAAAGAGPFLTTDFLAGNGLPATAGGDGSAGLNGGGGGAIQNSGLQQNLWGGAGGGGGKGGAGGKGGGGGLGGGSSFAVMITGSAVSVSGCTLTTGNAGAGGVGGRGGSGGFGGNGGVGFSPPAFSGLKPGNGGPGGQGGAGGGGGGGSGGNGGSSIGILSDAASTVVESGNTFTLGQAGAGGSGGLHGNIFLGQGAQGNPGLRQNTLTGVAP